jgi:hypothetical protein
MWSFYFSHVRLTFQFWVTAKSFECLILGGRQFHTCRQFHALLYKFNFNLMNTTQVLLGKYSADSVMEESIFLEILKHVDHNFSQSVQLAEFVHHNSSPSIETHRIVSVSYFSVFLLNVSDAISSHWQNIRTLSVADHFRFKQLIIRSARKLPAKSDRSVNVCFGMDSSSHVRSEDDNMKSVRSLDRASHEIVPVLGRYHRATFRVFSIIEGNTENLMHAESYPSRFARCCLE